MVVCSSSYVGLRLLKSSHSAYLLATTKSSAGLYVCRLSGGSFPRSLDVINVSCRRSSKVPVKSVSTSSHNVIVQSILPPKKKIAARAAVHESVLRQGHCKHNRSLVVRKGSALVEDCASFSDSSWQCGPASRVCQSDHKPRAFFQKPRCSPRRVHTTAKLDSQMEAQVLAAKKAENKEPAQNSGKGSASDNQSAGPHEDMEKKQAAEQIAVVEEVPTSNTHNRGDLTTITVGGLSLQGVSVGGQETCIIIPSMKIAFDIGRCPQRAVFQENVLISHAHMDHIGGICLQAATRGLFSMKPPQIVVPKVIVPAVENLFDAFRALDNAELEHKLVGLGVGEELRLTGTLFVKPFQTYHVVPSQGYVVYSRRQKLKKEFVGLPGPEIGRLRKSGVEVTDVEDVPEVAFTGDTTAEFITDPANSDVLRAKLLIMEMTFIDDSSTVEHARKYGHTHIDEVVPLAHLFQNEAILFIHFSARYRRKDILDAIEGLPPEFKAKVTPLLERF